MPLSYQCLECKHYKMQQVCAAFRGKIPDEIYEGRHNHKQPFGGELKIKGELVLFEAHNLKPVA